MMDEGCAVGGTVGMWEAARIRARNGGPRGQSPPPPFAGVQRARAARRGKSNAAGPWGPSPQGGQGIQVREAHSFWAIVSRAGAQPAAAGEQDV